MILRIVRGRVRAARLRSVADRFERRYAPVARTTPGLQRYHVAVRPDGEDHELVVVTFWSSVEAALAAYGGNLDTDLTLDQVSGGDDAATGVEGSSVAYFEVDETQLRSSTADAAALRITVGRVRQGLDAAIQHELRERMRDLDAGLSEAYVGRRILGTEVEVAFVSAWQKPADRRLDQPIWPDISGRYDAFEIAVFTPLLSGAAAG
jgi:heme-degrading monooxygenase HmoA